MTLRAADADDAGQVFGWRNHPEIVARGSLRRPVGWEEHANWFAETVRGERRRLWIVQRDGADVGQVRFDRLDDGRCAISAYLLPSETGRGAGVAAISEGCRLVDAVWRPRAIVAWVRNDNAQGRSAFRKAGFGAVSPSSACPADHEELVLCVAAHVAHNRVQFDEGAARVVAAVVAGGKVAGCGEQLQRLEAGLEAATGRRHARGVGSGLGALRLALEALGVGPGDEVIVPAYCCVAIPNAALALGATPVAVDVEPDTWNLDPAAAEAARTPRTRALVVVHTFGQPAEVARLAALSVPVVEDCAHALGFAVGGRPVGQLADVAVTSFYATKLVGGAEGGAVMTDREDVARHVEAARDYADRPASARGLNDRMNELEAALAAERLRQLPEMLEMRSALAGRYLAALSPLAKSGRLRLPLAGAARAWYRFAVAVPGDLDHVRSAFRQYGIGVERPVDWWLPAAQAGALPVAAAASSSLLSLPLYPTLSDVEQERVIAATRDLLGGPSS